MSTITIKWVDWSFDDKPPQGYSLAPAKLNKGVFINTDVGKIEILEGNSSRVKFTVLRGPFCEFAYIHKSVHTFEELIDKEELESFYWKEVLEHTDTKDFTRRLDFLLKSEYLNGRRSIKHEIKEFLRDTLNLNVDGIFMF